MIDLLTWVIVGLVLIQPNADRLYLALIFATLTQVHNSFMNDLDGLAYFGSAGLFDLIILSAAASMPVISGFSIRIGVICVVSIVLNAMGAALWALYVEPAIYDTMFMFLYAWAVFVLIKKDQDDVGDSPVGRWVTRVCGYDSPRCNSSKRHGAP